MDTGFTSICLTEEAKGVQRSVSLKKPVPFTRKKMLGADFPFFFFLLGFSDIFELSQ